MKYYIDLITNKNHNSGEIKTTRITSPIIPTEEEFEQWKQDTLSQYLLGVDFLPMFIEYEKDEFIKLVKQLYQKINKKVELFQEDTNLFRILTKQGAFFEDIDHIKLYNDTYQDNIAVIKMKLTCQKKKD